MTSDTNIGKMGMFAQTLTLSSFLPKAYSLGSKKYLSSSTVAAIVDNSSGQWLLRVDKAHRGTKFPHININHRLTKIPDPHLKISEGQLSTLSAINSTMSMIGKYSGMLYIFATSCRLYSAIKKDTCEKTFPSETSKLATSIAAESVGAVAGGSMGGKIGSVTGWCVAGMPGAAVGNLAGTTVGAVAGATTGNHLAGHVTKENVVSALKTVGGSVANVTKSGVHFISKL